MTISTEPAPLSYSGDDSTTAFPITYKYFAKSDVVATLRDSSGTETVWVLATNYTLTAAGVDAGGTLTATIAPATGETLVITLEPPNTQDKSLPLGGPFPSTNVEDGLDIATQRDAKIQDLLNRTMQVPKTDTRSGSQLEMPNETARASQFLSFNANGDPAVSSGTGADSGLRADVGSITSATKGSFLVGIFLSITGYVGRTLSAWIASRPYYTSDFGCVGGGADETTKLQNAIDAAGSGVLVHDAGNSQVLTPLTVSSNLTLYAENGSIIDGTNASFVGADVIKFEGSGFTQIAELNANVSKGDSSFTFASSITLVAGDIFVIANPTNSSWSGFNVNYKAGEYCEVLSVSSNTVKLKNPLYDDYVVADVDIYKQDSITPIIRDIEINGDVSDYVINLKYCKDARVINVTSTHQNEATLSESHCYATEIHRPTWNNYGDGGNDYGWLSYSSQHSRMFGGNVYSRRHAVTMGGGVGTGIVPSRDIKAIGSVLKNDVASVVHNFDWHGHAEDCQAIDCTIYGGAIWQGKNNGYVNCDIHSSSEGWVIQAAEILGGKHYARGCRLKTEIDPNAVSRGVIDVAGNSNAVTSDTAEDATFIAEGCSLESASLSTSTNLVTIRNRGTTQKLNVNIDNFTLDVNAYGNILFMDLVSGTAASDFVRVENINSNVSYDSKIVDIRDDYDAGNYQVLTGAGAVDLTHKVTHIDTTGGAAALTLADSYEGHEKFLAMTIDVGDGTLTPDNLGNGTTITFINVGDSAHLIVINGAWHMVGGTATLA